MPFSHVSTVRATAVLLLLGAITQSIYTALYSAGMEVPRTLLWGTEGMVFVLMAAFAGAALAQARMGHLGWSAITAAAVLNVVQVGVGLTLFAPFGEVAKAEPALAPLAGAVVALSFMIYNAAKVLLALAAIDFGRGRMRAGGRVLGGLTAFVGLVALISNALSMAMGRTVLGDLPLAGGSGVLATLLLAACLFTASGDD